MKPQFTQEFLIEQGLNPEFITPEFLESQQLSPSAPARFLQKVDRNGPTQPHCEDLGQCWVWLGSTTRASRTETTGGYGTLRKGTRGCRPHHIVAHQASWIFHFGPVPDGMWVLHRCDYQICVRPQHLFLGTALANVADAITKRRFTHGEQSPHHVLTWADVHEIRRLYATGDVTYKDLMRRFGVGLFAIHSVVHRTRWKWGDPVLAVDVERSEA